MSPDFEPPPLWASVLATAGGIVTAIAIIIGLKIGSTHLDRKFTPTQTTSHTAPTRISFS